MSVRTNHLPKTSRQTPDLRDNLLLSKLPGEERARIGAFLKLVELKAGDELIGSNEPILNVYFPVNMVSSTLQELSDGSSIEVGLMGMEGLVGIQLWLMQRTTPSHTIAQIGGLAYKMSAEVFIREVMETGSSLNPLIASYIHAFLNMTAQTSACNRMHEVATRLAKWLSLVYDRVLVTDFTLRQEFLAEMLGVHRPSVTIAASTLQKAGLISYRRGSIHIEDPVALRRTCCECYGIIESQFDALYGRGWRERTQAVGVPQQHV